MLIVNYNIHSLLPVFYGSKKLGFSLGDEMMQDEQLGKSLRHLREQRGWSLDYVADICGTSGPNLSKIERGQPKEYRLELLSKLASAYGLRTYELFALAEQIELIDVDALASDETDLLRTYRNLTVSQRQVANAVIETLVQP
jgi:transcriptional regulator with XRE-family HTH domain